MTRPRSHSAGSSYVRQNAKFGQKVFPKDKSEEGGRSGNRYKTELCRPYQQYGFCKYGEKCQFAHGEHDLREVPRHPKYKTELCRTFHARGFCPYGSRCHFIHSFEEARKSTESNRPKSPKKSVGFSGPTIGFNLPISPSLDSGISSPATDDMVGVLEARTFEFPLPPESSVSEEDREQQSMYLLARNSYSPIRVSGDYTFSQFDSMVNQPTTQFGSPDPFIEFDALSTGSGSPMKTPSEGFASSSEHDFDLSDLLMGTSLQDKVPSVPVAMGSPSNRGRLPVFDDIIQSKSETALQQVA